MKLLASLCALVLIASACTATEPLKYAKANTDYAKPGAAVELEYAFSSVPNTATGNTLSLRLVPKTAVDSMTVNVTGSDGVKVTKDASLSVAKMGASDIKEHKVGISPVANGRHYINVFVETVTGGQHMRRAFAIPVQVGADQGTMTKPQVQTDAQGNPVIELPAERR